MQKYVNARSRGFTLVELLVVIGIIAALAAVVIPNVSKFVGAGDASANDTERQTVQAALDLYIADLGLTSINATTAWVGRKQAPYSNLTDFSDFVVSGSTPANLYPNYLRVETTKCSYEWDSTGKIEDGALGQDCS